MLIIWTYGRNNIKVWPNVQLFNVNLLIYILSMKGGIEKIRILEIRFTNVLLSHLHFDRIEIIEIYN